MNGVWRHRLHRCVRGLGWIAAAAAIVMAVLMVLVQALLPRLAAHPAWVAEKLSQRMQRPVNIVSMEGRRTLSGPLLVLRGITIGAAAGQPGAPVQIPEATLKFDTGGWLLPSRHLLNVYMSGLQLGLTRSSDDHWSVNGIALGGQRESAVPSGGPSLGLWLSDVTLDVNDAVLGTHSRWHSAQLRLSRQHGWLRAGAVLQREDAPGVLRAAGRFREDGSSGKLWLGADKVDLDALLKGIDMAGYAADQGHGKLAAWLDWHQGRVTGGTLRLDLADLVITSPSGGQANVPALHGVAGIRKRDDGYDVRWASDRGGALALSLRQPGTAQLRIGVAARDLELTPLLPWLALKPGMAVGLAHWLGAGHPRGVLSHVAMHWSQADGLRMLDVAFTGLGIDPVGNLPGVTALHGELRGDAEALSLSLPEQATSLQFSHLFRQPLGLAALGGTLAFWPQEGVWHIGIDSLDFRGAGYAGQIRGEVVLPEPGGHPFVDAYAVLKHADVTAAKLFWPMHSMSPATIAWLDHALLGGTIDQADVVLRGDLGDWPFAHNEGRFEARAQISDLILDYDEDWPQAEGINVVANFINNGMLVEASGGQSLGVKLDQAVALIPDFGEGLLDLNVRGHGAGSQLMGFVTKSPIARDEADTMDKLKLGGSATFDFHMALPLHGDGKLNLSGNAQLKNADFSAPEWDLQLGKLTGPLRFDARGLQAGPLQAEYRGEPSTLKLAIAGGTEDPSTVLSAQLNGRYGVDQLIGAYPSLEWLSKVISGRSDFAVGFTLAHAVDGKGMTQRLTVASPLNGMALALPAPLNKPADTELPLQLSMDLPMDGSDLQLALGSQLRAHFRLANGPGKPLAAVLAFGDQMPQTLPLEGLRVRGHAAQLDVTGWVQHAMASSAGDGPGLESMEVSTDQAEWFGRLLGAMQVRAKPQPDVLSVDVDGVAMAGNFSIPRQELDKRGITARLQRLYWPKDTAEPEVAAAVKAAPAAAASTASTAAGAVVAADNPADEGIDPASIPPLHLWVHDLRLGPARLGEARLESWPTPEGMHIDQLRALSSRVQITANGDWNGSAHNSRTHMRIEFAAESLGDMLAAFGYEGLFNGGQTRDQLDASWPGAPSALALANMSGTLKVHVSDGRIPEVTPGVGRLFGLISVAELPRRLTLDFGDVFGKGLAFDTIDGDFHLDKGDATTHNLVIQGPAANISINGRTGLRTKDYDQQVVVVPHVGSSLPIVGAVVGGPVGAAAGFAVQGLLGKGLNQAARARYRITGSWDKPTITLLEKHAAKPPAAPLLSPAASPPAAASEMPATPPSSLLLVPAATSSAAPATSSSVQR